MDANKGTRKSNDTAVWIWISTTLTALILTTPAAATAVIHDAHHMTNIVHKTHAMPATYLAGPRGATTHPPATQLAGPHAMPATHLAGLPPCLNGPHRAYSARTPRTDPSANTGTGIHRPPTAAAARTDTTHAPTPPF